MHLQFTFLYLYIYIKLDMKKLTESAKRWKGQNVVWREGRTVHLEHEQKSAGACEDVNYVLGRGG